ncbi:putative Prepilin-like protein [Nitrospina gracilis 3/211]|uniref:Putative Prepilin-like protein n=1 Tax=Nitrospina gracilis (strain 3/211) TaxID=1266370 RepID=M1YYH0_NITG3|nr:MULTISPECIES: prepilin-type N-terminal cleavage/methylation domain-containing protein [Nitrospina]MCF8723468.1 prepilin-type N-terminal cleavage/methylation domain-containing protein [Nitrospina sp. Nb-3]CCQ90534.1 putative Prepilin-like protein [Nitrospina gracilis 3/211]
MMYRIYKIRPARLHSEGGFTLMEIIIAILIVGIAVPSIMIAFSSLKGSVIPEYTIEAAELAQLQMEAISEKTRTQIPAAGSYTCAAFQATVTEVQCAVAGFGAYTFAWVVADVDANDPDTSNPGATFAKKVTLTVTRANMTPVSFYALFATD